MGHRQPETLGGHFAIGGLPIGGLRELVKLRRGQGGGAQVAVGVPVSGLAASQGRGHGVQGPARRAGL